MQAAVNSCYGYPLDKVEEYMLSGDLVLSGQGCLSKSQYGQKDWVTMYLNKGMAAVF